MKDGNWVPLSKNFLSELPLDRPYTKLEAAYSLQIDYDQNKNVTVRGYSRLWSWSRKKVSKFLDDMGIFIEYPIDVKNKPNQKGPIGLHKRSQQGANKGHMKLIDSKWLDGTRNIKGANKEPIRSQQGSTTKDPNPNPKKKYRDFVYLLNDEYQKLCDDYGKNIVDSKIEDLDLYIGSKGKVRLYKDHNRVIRAWLKKAGVKMRGEDQPKPAWVTCPTCQTRQLRYDIEKNGRCINCGKRRE